ncbi:MAG: DUF1844 domain-containing protein [Rubritalea sp.]|uniref:DUF1844 domain-containing protein n=1 Tax=Rubritalea sp. TaxID=2109375 RepID=UPI003242C488
MSDSPQADNRFTDFILLQAQNAGLFLGQLPHPTTGQRSVNLKAAGSVINCLEMLVSKTSGNLTNSESQLLEKALVNLRSLYKEAEDLA